MTKRLDLPKIKVEPSPTADSRYCDFENVTKEQLLESSKQHIEDVRRGLERLGIILMRRGQDHDFTKLTHIDMFYKDFVGGFKEYNWYKFHKQEERHHIADEDGIREDVDLIDVLEFIVDTIMAGLARGGAYYKHDIDPELLVRAYDNTIDKFLKEVEYTG